MRAGLIAITLAAMCNFAIGADWELPRATDVTATDAMIECVSTDDCEVSVACTLSMPEVADFEDSDFVAVDGSPIENGETLMTPLITNDMERCVLRVIGDANITGFRYVRMKTEHESFYFSGLTEVPIHRVRSVSQVVLPRVNASNLFDVYLAHSMVTYSSASAIAQDECDHIKEGHKERGYCEDGVSEIIRRLVYTVADAFSSCLANGAIDEFAGDPAYSRAVDVIWLIYDEVVSIVRLPEYACIDNPDQFNCYECGDLIPALE